MRLWPLKLEIKKMTKKYKGRDFTKEDQDSAQKVKQLNTEIRRLNKEAELMQKRAEIESLRAQLFPPPPGQEDAGPFDAMAQAFMGRMMQGQALGGEVQMPPAQSSLSDDEIKDFLKTLSKSQLKQAKKMPPAILKRMFPVPLTDEEFNRAYTILQNDF